MIKKNSLNSHEKALFTEIKKEVNALTDAKLHSLYYTPHPLNNKFDRHEIENECETLLFNKFEEKLSKIVDDLREFRILLQNDCPLIFDKIEMKSEQLSDKLNAVHSFKDISKIHGKLVSKPDLEELNRIGMKYFEDHMFLESHLYFFFLTVTDPENPSFWLAKGMAEQNLKMYEEALGSYSIVLHLAPHSIMTYIQIMETLILMQRIDEASKVFEIFQNEIPESRRQDSFIKTKLQHVKKYLMHPVG